MKKKLTAEDPELNPELKEQGLKEGDEIEIPEPLEGDGLADDTGGSNPPPEERPDDPVEP